jgi:hypothetical protein
MTLDPAIRDSIGVAVNDAMGPVVDDVHEIRRAIVGAPLEGNPGILKRMDRTEKKVAWLIWSIPIWVTAGTGLGQVLIKWWNI